MRQPGPYWIYALIDPRTDEIRYIGKSTSGKQRYNSHHSKNALQKPTHVARWLRQLSLSHLKAELLVLEQHPTPDRLTECEIWWIAYGRAVGWPLTNLTDGGEGRTGYTCSEETKAKIGAAQVGRTLDPDHIVKLSESAKARTDGRLGQRFAAKALMTPEHAARCANVHWAKPDARHARSEVMLQMWANPDYVRAQAAAHAGHTPSEETKRKQRANAPRGEANPAKRPENRLKISEGLRRAWARRKSNV